MYIRQEIPPLPSVAHLAVRGKSFVTVKARRFFRYQGAMLQEKGRLQPAEIFTTDCYRFAR